MATRRICPPLNSNGERSSNSGDNPTAAEARSTRFSISSGSTPKFSGPNAISFATVSANIDVQDIGRRHLLDYVRHESLLASLSSINESHQSVLHPKSGVISHSTIE